MSKKIPGGVTESARYSKPVWQVGKLLIMKLWSISSTPGYQMNITPYRVNIFGLNHHTRPELLGFPTGSYYITRIGFEFYRRGGDGIGKAGNGYQRARAGMFGNVVIQTQPC